MHKIGNMNQAIRYCVTLNIILQPLFTLFVDSVMETFSMSTTSSLSEKYCTVKMLTQNSIMKLNFLNQLKTATFISLD